ncbi:hypothetical protein VNO77_19912 [Canavalia gladiata]|uniref:Uncharacterized protein n=1 Tax=Canavalia gladiata TaxID=3824 RepID=A0AAN9LNN9_CANGL
MAVTAEGTGPTSQRPRRYEGSGNKIGTPTGCGRMSSSSPFEKPERNKEKVARPGLTRSCIKEEWSAHHAMNKVIKPLPTIWLTHHGRCASIGSQMKSPTSSSCME